MWFLFSAGALTLDRILKHKARKKELPDLLIPGGSVAFRPIENDGLAGGTLRSRPKLARYLPALTLLLTAPALLRGFKDRRPAAKCGISLLLGGAAGNVFDRLFHGTVTDMICFTRAPGRLKKLVFNVADLMILLGSLLTLFASCKSRRNVQ